MTAKEPVERIMLSHGGGGKLARELLERELLPVLADEALVADFAAGRYRRFFSDRRVRDALEDPEIRDTLRQTDVRDTLRRLAKQARAAESR